MGSMNPKQWKVRIIVGNRMLFLLILGGFSDLTQLEQLKFKLEKNIGIQKSAEKVWKS